MNTKMQNNASYQTRGSLEVADCLVQFIEQHALPGTGVESNSFWQGFAQLLQDLQPQNQALLDERASLQQQIDTYCQANPQLNAEDYQRFLHKIGYLLPQPSAQAVLTDNVDNEIAHSAGPQLVVPINNARYALNAANARWGSLYDALYGTDVLPESAGCEKTAQYNPKRGDLVVKKAREILDQFAPLQQGSHQQAQSYQLTEQGLQVILENGSQSVLANPEQLVGLVGSKAQPQAILLGKHGLHLEIQFDAAHPVAQRDPAGIKDILLESALTTIMDCEDSVAAVDAEDKTLVYQNWLGLMQGKLTCQVIKNGQSRTRAMQDDRQYQRLNGETFSLPGRSLMFVRNVGHLMRNNAILLNGEPVFEGLMDAVITSLISKHDLLGNSQYKNSRTGSIYIVKPKMHGPDEVAFSNHLFSRVEAMLGLESNTIKMGIMDEERRTSLNLQACIQAAKHRVAFINTGFLDRTGDEIHTSMQLAAFAPKAALKQKPWIQSYEVANVATGLANGLSGKAQIGKGMWPVPDHMAQMLKEKVAHPQAGANTAWVPSPTAATLHALHYHQINVFAQQQQLPPLASDWQESMLNVPVLGNEKLSADAVQRELDNNIQGILGYVVRWVHQGIGCSKVPDINNVGLMEDRATLRISSQHICNWLMHGLVSEDQIHASMLRMAALVDSQNNNDAEYIPLGDQPERSIAFQAAQELILQGHLQPSGYTEPVLHKKRQEMKAKLAS